MCACEFVNVRKFPLILIQDVLINFKIKKKSRRQNPKQAQLSLALAVIFYNIRFPFYVVFACRRYDYMNEFIYDFMHTPTIFEFIYIYCPRRYFRGFLSRTSFLLLSHSLSLFIFLECIFYTT